ncbi:MAG: PTS sugar transporter subunit IIC [Erysipelotrichaceae bacterium]|nr:PTS sugar transporter subunit IIC [Erysipelotrichaceae bacterium]MDY5251615.1 PTS sugar transporter subunit IIC [Erysipelotrichaceae bacterium]
MLFEAIIVSILAAILSIEGMNGQFQFAAPLVSGTLTGLVLGDMTQGIIIGASLQLVFMGVSGVGAAVPPDKTIGTVVATAFAILSGVTTEVALSFAVVVAVASQALDIFGRTFTTIFMHMADGYAEKRQYSKMSMIHYAGIIVTFVRVFILVFPAIYLGVGVVESMMNVIPEWVLRGLEVSGGMLPAVGFGMLMTMLNIPYLFPFFFIGFALATFAGFSTVGVTMVAVCIALIFDYQKRNKSNDDNHNDLDDLDSLME